MRLLALSTSSPALSLALFDAGRLIAHDHRRIGRGHAEALVPAIAALPDNGRADAVVVDIGPGSFTGIRIGIAAARALALAWGVPATGVSAAALVAAAGFAARPDAPALTLWLDAGRGQAFRQEVGADFGMGEIATLAAAAAGADGIAEPDMRWLLAVPAALRSLPPAALYVRPPDAVLPL